MRLTFGSGAIKSNVGHVEGSAGLASVIKTILILEKGLIPPNANFESINPKIDEKALGIRASGITLHYVFMADYFKIVSKSTPWPSLGLRRASVNSFGASGTNCHVVLDDVYNFCLQCGIKANHCTAPLPSSGSESENILQINGNQSPCQVDTREAVTECPRLLVLSAASEKSLIENIEALRRYVSKLQATGNYQRFLTNLLHTYNTRRSVFPWRSSTVIERGLSLSDSLSKISTPSYATTKSQIVFVFTGQGAQWAGMGHELLEYSIYRNSLTAADEYMRSLGSGWSLLGSASTNA